MKDVRPLLELTGAMQDALLDIYLGLPVKHPSAQALRNRALATPTPTGWRLTDRGIAYLSAYVQALRLSPAILDTDRRRYHKLGFRHMQNPHLAPQPPRDP